jgi:signal transduction histidine kinase
LSESHRRAVETIGSSGEHLLGLINDILDLSKIEAGREELTQTTFELGAFVQSLATMFALRCQQGLAWHLEEAPPTAWVRGDQNRLRQVLINLLGNAVKFTERGEVALRVLPLEGDRYEFAVRDTGPGIPLERQEAIFEPFQQEEAGQRHRGTGLGLGLAIAKRHVELMGGRLRVDCKPGEGARLAVVLPLPPGQASARRAEQDWSRVERIAGDCTVQALIVDDVPTNLQLLAQILGRIGVEVDCAGPTSSFWTFWTCACRVWTGLKRGGNWWPSTATPSR